MTKVRKAVIPAAGLGTRLLTATLAVPKELLPLDRKPAIHHIVEEAAQAGLDTIILVLARGKELVADYFCRTSPFPGGLGKPALDLLVDSLVSLANRVEVVTVYQDSPRGLGHAVLCAREAIGNDSFALMLPDDHFIPRPLRRLVEIHEQTGRGSVLLRKVADEKCSRYGIAVPHHQEPTHLVLDRMVEKPAPGTEPSNLAIMGRYVFPARILDILENQPPGVGGEIQITDAMNRLAALEGMAGMVDDSTYLDLGTWEGYVLANAYLGLQDAALAARLKELLADHS